jgi:hypothetical protein
MGKYCIAKFRNCGISFLKLINCSKPAKTGCLAQQQEKIDAKVCSQKQNIFL